MSNDLSRDDQDDTTSGDMPKEFTFTDLGRTPEFGLDDPEGDAGLNDIHAVGTPGGGTASGGLGGTNAGDGSPENVDLENAMGSGIFDTDEGENAEVEGDAPYAGRAGGAVGGTPAERRATGGATHGGIAPGSTHRGDSTIGGDPMRSSE